MLVVLRGVGGMLIRTLTRIRRGLCRKSQPLPKREGVVQGLVRGGNAVSLIAKAGAYERDPWGWCWWEVDVLSCV